MKLFRNVRFVNEGWVLRGDILIDGEWIANIDKPGRIPLPARARLIEGRDDMLLLPGVIDEHIHSREPGYTWKGDLGTETRAAAAGGVTSVIDMPNVKPPTTTLETLSHRMGLGDSYSFVNYSFYFGANNTNANLLSELDPRYVPGVKVFMGKSTGELITSDQDALQCIFERSPFPIVAHCEDTEIIDRNMQQAIEKYGPDPAISHHAEIRSREACLAASTLAASLALETGAHLHIAHVSTKEELSLTNPNVTLEACLPHLLFAKSDYHRLRARIKCNPAVKSAEDRNALRAALTNGTIATIATDHAPHLINEKQGGCVKAASGIPMVQFSLPAMLELMDEGVLTIQQLVELMCHNPARLFEIEGRGFIREGYKADLVLVRHQSWTLKREQILSRCGWSPLERHTFPWRVVSTYCNGRRIYHEGVLLNNHLHAQRLRFARERLFPLYNHEPDASL